MTAPVSARHDVVMIGGGHNGLAAGDLLADTGLDVCVVEAGADTGGFTATGPVIPEAPVHLINSCPVDAFFWDAFPPSYELALERHGLRRVTVDPGTCTCTRTALDRLLGRRGPDGRGHRGAVHPPGGPGRAARRLRLHRAANH